MNGNNGVTCYDRASGALITETVYGGGFLGWSYNTIAGQLATDLFFRQKWVSRLYGWLYKQPWSRREITSFVKQYNVNMDESLRPVQDFKSFNDFFTREIDISKRPVRHDPRVCVCPADGRVLAYPAVEVDRTFRIKRSTFNLRAFVCNDALAETFAGGSMVIVRLYLPDYHHFHFPASGIPGHPVSIQGKYYAGGPYALHSLIPFYTENYRMLTLMEADHFGQIAMAEVGAFTVGSIHQRFRPGVRVAKGSRKGFFELGGSTVVLLFHRDSIELDQDLCANTREEMETYVRLGDSIGRM